MAAAELPTLLQSGLSEVLELHHPETELRKAKANFEGKHAFLDFFATHVVVDGNHVTGQNQKSSGEASHRILEILAKK
jgi:putative intracellular protease/amidase